MGSALGFGALDQVVRDSIALVHSVIVAYRLRECPLIPRLACYVSTVVAIDHHEVEGNTLCPTSCC